MGLFHEIKCGKCDRRYSSIRSKCPYCGARKSQGKRAVEGESDKKQTQMIIGIIALIVVIVVVVILVATSLRNQTEKNGGRTDDPNPTSSIGSSSGVSGTAGTQAPTGGSQSGGSTGAEGETGSETGTETEGETGGETGGETTKPPEETRPAVTINSILLNRADFTLSEIGATWNLKPQVSPAGTDVEIEWTSSDEGVATVDETGTVTAVNRGTCTVTAAAGGAKAECIVRVTATAPAGGSSGSSGNTGTSSSGISLSHTDVTISSASSETFTLSVRGATSEATFSSSDTSIATVDASGKVTAVGKGTATVYVSVDGQTLSCIVRVR